MQTETKEPEAKAPATKTTEISIKVDLLKVSKDVCEHLAELLTDTSSYVIPPQGQATLQDLASTAMERMLRYVREVEGMPDDNFMMVDEPARAAKAEAKAKAKAEAEKRAVAQRKAEAEAKAKVEAEAEAKAKTAMEGQKHAGGHEGRQHVQGAETGRR